VQETTSSTPRQRRDAERAFARFDEDKSSLCLRAGSQLRERRCLNGSLAAVERHAASHNDNVNDMETRSNLERAREQSSASVVVVTVGGVVYQNGGFTPAWSVSQWWLAGPGCHDRRSAWVEPT